MSRTSAHKNQFVNKVVSKQNMPKNKSENKRNPNWTKLETDQLVSAIIERNYILKASHGALENAEARKKKAWEEISQCVSAVSPVGLRSVDDCKTREGYVIKVVTKKALAYNKEINKTGKKFL